MSVIPARMLLFEVEDSASPPYNEAVRKTKPRPHMKPCDFTGRNFVAKRTSSRQQATTELELLGIG
jgi:hypothetical protein